MPKWRIEFSTDDDYAAFHVDADTIEEARKKAEVELDDCQAIIERIVEERR